MAPKPYYEAGGVTLYHGDCREILPAIKAELLALDPPYGTSEHGGYGRRQLGLQRIANDADSAVRDAVLGAWGDRPAIVFGSPRRPEPPGRWDYRLIWDKRSPGLGSPWRWRHEMIYLRGRWVNRPGTPSILSVSPPSRKMRERNHPHEKPIALMVALLRGSSGTIVDACAGSGATLRAAQALGRVAIGIELDEQYCEVAARLLEQEIRRAG